MCYTTFSSFVSPFPPFQHKSFFLPLSGTEEEQDEEKEGR